MKVIITIFLTTCLFVGLGVYYTFLGYRSAFEADQACHAKKWEDFGESDKYGCDHDLETDQWILYEVGLNHSPAKVLKRFHYQIFPVIEVDLIEEFI